MHKLTNKFLEEREVFPSNPTAGPGGLPGFGLGSDPNAAAKIEAKKRAESGEDEWTSKKKKKKKKKKQVKNELGEGIQKSRRQLGNWAKGTDDIPRGLINKYMNQLANAYDRTEAKKKESKKIELPRIERKN